VDQRLPRGLFSGAIALVCLLASSCSFGRLKVYPVRGQVFHDNTPAEGALVVFHLIDAADPASPKPRGQVGADGGFTLTTYVKGDGAPAGDYVVAIVWYPKDAKPDPKTGERANLLPEEYAGTASPLRAKVHETDNVLPAFVIPK